MWWRTVLIVIGVCGGLLLLLYLFQPRLVYFPTRDLAMTPAAIGLVYEEVRFAAADGVTLAGWFVPADDPLGVVLFCHGNAGNISHRLESIEVFHRLRYSVFIFDYRGYGQSEGRTTEQGTYADVEAAWRYLRQERGIDASQIVVFGRSLGGAVAAWLAKGQAPRALIVESTFTSVRDLASRIYPFLPVRMLARFRYATEEYLREVHCPVLIVHSRDDEMIPFELGLRLFAATNEPKQFLEIRGTHNEGFLVSLARYEAGLGSFLTSLDEE